MAEGRSEMVTWERRSHSPGETMEVWQERVGPARQSVRELATCAIVRCDR